MGTITSINTSKTISPYIELYTKNLRLTVLLGLSPELLVDYLSRNESFWKPWSPTTPASYFQLSYQREHLKRQLLQMQQGEALRFYLFHKHNPHKIIGDIGFTHIIRGVFQSCFLSYKIDKNEQQKGYMTEALTKVITFVFNELKLHRIEANIMPRNTASIKTVEKLNFQYEGTSKKYLKINGQWEDHCHYVLLNDTVE